MGLTGFVWCVLAGLCYGTMNVFAKLAYNNGMIVSRFILTRFIILFVMSYIFGKFVRGTNFDLRKYDKKVLMIVFGRSCLSLLSKTMQYSAISYIPLSMSSCISFTTGPIFAAILAFVMIREKLKFNEILPIIFGIVGTCMITMPEWFLWTGIDTSAI
jgi:drug/metabolite transporter (DMT)-like permease